MAQNSDRGSMSPIPDRPSHVWVRPKPRAMGWTVGPRASRPTIDIGTAMLLEKKKIIVTLDWMSIC